MAEGPLGGPRPLSSCEATLTISFKSPITGRNSEVLFKEVQNINSISAPVEQKGDREIDVKYTASTVSIPKLESLEAEIDRLVPGDVDRVTVAIK